MKTANKPDVIWQTKKLSEVFEIRPPKKEGVLGLKGSDLVSFIPMEDLGILAKNFIASKEKRLKDVYGSYTYFSDNDVLLAKITPCFENGKLGIAQNLKNRVGFGSSEYIVFRSKGQVIPVYLFYFLSTDKFREEGKKRMSGAVGHKRVSKEFIENSLISYPESQPEQKRIVKILDEVFEDIEKAKKNTEKNLQNAKELFETYLQSIFINPRKDWTENKFSDIYDVRDGTHDSPKYQKEGYPLITSKNLKRAGLNFNHIKLISEIDYRKINERSNINKGDVLFAMIGTIGNPIVVDIEPNFAIKNVALFKNSKNQNSYFLKYYLESKHVIEKMINEAKGTTQKFVSLGYLRNFTIKLPTLYEQNSIVKKLDALSNETKKLESIYNQKLAYLEELKKSILEKAFQGKL